MSSDVATLYRALNFDEFTLLKSRDYWGFPPRVISAPGEAPVRSRELADEQAHEIAVKDRRGCAYLVAFEMPEATLAEFEIERSTSPQIWLDSFELEIFNAQILGPIKLVSRIGDDSGATLVSHIYDSKILAVRPGSASVVRRRRDAVARRRFAAVRGLENWTLGMFVGVCAIEGESAIEYAKRLEQAGAIEIEILKAVCRNFQGGGVSLESIQQELPAAREREFHFYMNWRVWPCRDLCICKSSQNLGISHDLSSAWIEYVEGAGPHPA